MGFWQKMFDVVGRHIQVGRRGEGKKAVSLVLTSLSTGHEACHDVARPGPQRNLKNHLGGPENGRCSHSRTRGTVAQT